MFSESFFECLVYGALAWTALGIVALIGLLFRDAKGASLW